MALAPDCAVDLHQDVVGEIAEPEAFERSAVAPGDK
jgi:hypothetical protein